MYEILSIDGGVSAPRGFFANGIFAGLKKPENGVFDVGYIFMQESCEVKAYFTSNAFKAAPLVHFLNHVQGEKSNFILINTKNANAMTGEAGVRDIQEILAKLCEIYPQIQNPIMSSTGVIGVRLPKEKIISCFGQITLDEKPCDGIPPHTRAARAIMTTDSFPKEVALEVILPDHSSFRIGAMAKGAGMINPSLATMLCFITTDAKIPPEDLDEILQECIENSFNTISVDGDMSTNDSIFFSHNGKSDAYDKQAFRHALGMALEKLALDILRDGEGANKVVAFRVTGAKDAIQAKRVAKALSNSPLVKTAIFGGDPNWGRIASTIGACGAKSDMAINVQCAEKSLSISIAGVKVYDRGVILFDSQIEQKAAKAMQKESFEIHCDLGIGDGSYLAYGCDLSYEYVKINADYRS